MGVYGCECVDVCVCLLVCEDGVCVCVLVCWCVCVNVLVYVAVATLWLLRFVCPISRVLLWCVALCCASLGRSAFAPQVLLACGGPARVHVFACMHPSDAVLHACLSVCMLASFNYVWRCISCIELRLATCMCLSLRQLAVHARIQQTRKRTQTACSRELLNSVSDLR